MPNTTQNINNQSITDMDQSLSVITTIEEMQAQFSRLQILSRNQPINDWETREAQLDN